MKKLTFKNAFELAKWIKSNISDELQQEQVMLKGVRNNYTITIQSWKTLYISKEHTLLKTM